MLPLFEDVEGFNRRGLAERLARLRDQGVWIGTSSWKYEGWLDQIYSRERYKVRGRFSTRLFEQECLAEYAEVFPIVCGDFSFYQFPADTYWAKLFKSAPSSLHYALKVPEEITVSQFPVHARYGPRAGLDNESFLNAPLLETMFLTPLDPYRNQVSALIFEFGAFTRKVMPSVDVFVQRLDGFLRQLPDRFRYSVEIRNSEFLGPEYFGCLRSHGVAHVFNAWSRMPEIGMQMQLPGVHTADFTLARALLRQGRAYEQAVQSFQPYQHIQDPNPETRSALRGLIAKAREKRQPAFLFVNNRLEGNAPLTIEAIVDD